jgi:hypothetical protein
MAIYVIRDGRLVEKERYHNFVISDFPTPMISRMEPYESPIDGKQITSWRQRDRDMRENDAVDPRDLSPRKKPDVRPEPTPEQLSFQWRDPSAE